MRALYVSYDGALDPLGRSQVVPYLEGLSELGWQHDLMTFEKPERFRHAGDVRAMKERLEHRGIRWLPQPYTKRPPLFGTAWDLARGVRRGARVAALGRYDLIHARSYPAAVIARALGQALDVPYLFDIRGLYPEERVDGGLWKAGGAVYRVTKRVEAGLYRDAAAVVTLTEASVPWIQRILDSVGGRAAIRVIPTCVDLNLFAPRPRPDGPFRLGYFGSVGTWYMLDEMLAFGAAVLDVEPKAALRFLVNSDPDSILASAERQGVATDRIEVASVRHDQVPDALAGVDATFFFIRRGLSAVGFHQTKLGESLALGLPVAAIRGVGDTDDILEGERVGIVVDGYDPAELRRAAAALVALTREPDTRARCRSVAEARYAMGDGVRAYARLYAEVAR